MTLNFATQLQHLVHEYEGCMERGETATANQIKYCMSIGMELLKPNSERDYELLNTPRLKAMLDTNQLD